LSSGKKPIGVMVSRAHDRENGPTINEEDIIVLD